ncbi:type II toxin-antitoxin system VapC family toxin [Actinomycetes bacterium KLBMP 9797]
MIVVDATVLIAHLNSADSCHDRAEALLLEAADYPLAASSITLAEVLVGPARAGRLGAARAALRALEVEEVPVPVEAAERLAVLRADTGLKLPDCCVLLAAEDALAEAVLTFDDRLMKRAQALGYGWNPGTHSS